MQTKITLRFHLTPDRMAKIKEQIMTTVGKTGGKEGLLFSVGRRGDNW